MKVKVLEPFSKNSNVNDKGIKHNVKHNVKGNIKHNVKPNVTVKGRNVNEGGNGKHKHNVKPKGFSLSKAIQQVENPPKGWEPDEKKSKGEKKRVDIENFEQDESEGISIGSNWIFLIVVAAIIALVTYMVVKELRNEGGGGQKVESPEPQSSPPASTVEPGREWASE